MGYTIEVGETRPLLDGNGDPLETAVVTSPSGVNPPFAVGLQAQIQDDGTGHLVCIGNSVGTITFDLKRGGTVASHEVTVVASSIPFDWSLGDPI